MNKSDVSETSREYKATQAPRLLRGIGATEEDPHEPRVGIRPNLWAAYSANPHKNTEQTAPRYCFRLLHSATDSRLGPPTRPASHARPQLTGRKLGAWYNSLPQRRRGRAGRGGGGGRG